MSPEQRAERAAALREQQNAAFLAEAREAVKTWPPLTSHQREVVRRAFASPSLAPSAPAAARGRGDQRRAS